MNRARPRVCRRCTGSPIVVAAGFDKGTPHQVVHALISRMHRIIDKDVELYTVSHLPILQSEFEGAAIWNAGGYEPTKGLDTEFDGIDPDAMEPEGEQPFLFTFAQLQAVVRPEPGLPRPPLTESEKRQLKMEIEVADRRASLVGQEICFQLLGYQTVVREAVERFVDPQVRSLLDELSRNLEAPNS